MRTKAFDIAYGLHSNIPDCCIAFYTDEWEDEWIRENSPYAKAVALANVKYVPCPKCLVSRNFIKLKDCLKECGYECWKDFEVKANAI